MKQKNSIIGIIFPGLFSVTFAILIGAISAYINFVNIFIIFIAYIVGHMMLKYLSYYTTFHKILAAVYALIAYLVYFISFVIISYLKIGYQIYEVIGYFNIVTFVKFIIANFGFFDWVLLVIIPVSAYAYLEKKGSLRR